MIIKRILDMLFGALGLILTSPLWLYVIIRIKAEDRGPVFFVQERVGKVVKYLKCISFGQSNIPDRVVTVGIPARVIREIKQS